MTGAESVKQKILSDADAECARIAAAAKAECERIIAAADAEIASGKAENEQRIQTEIAAKKRIAVSGAQLAAKKEALAAKQALIEQVFTTAVSRLCSADAKTQLGLLTKLAGECDIKGGETLRPSIAADKLLGGSLVESINASLKDRKIKAGAPTDEVSSGFVLESDNARQLCSYEAMADLYRDELEPQVAQILFGK